MMLSCCMLCVLCDVEDRAAGAAFHLFLSHDTTSEVVLCQ